MTILRRHLSRLQWVMAWEAAFHPEVPHSPPLPDQWGSPEKARHCRWGQNLLAEWKRQCHLFLFLTLIVRIQCKKVTPIITFFAKKSQLPIAENWLEIQKLPVIIRIVIQRECNNTVYPHGSPAHSTHIRRRSTYRQSGWGQEWCSLTA